MELIDGRGFSEAELERTLLAVYEEVARHDEVADAAGGYDLQTGVITIQAQPRDSAADRAEREQLQATLQPEQPADSAVMVDVSVVEELDARAEEGAADRAGGAGDRLGYVTMLAAVLLALLVGLLATRRRRRA